MRKSLLGNNSFLDLFLILQMSVWEKGRWQAPERERENKKQKEKQKQKERERDSETGHKRNIEKKD